MEKFDNDNKISEVLEILEDKSANEYLRYDIKESSIDETRNTSGDFYNKSYRDIIEYDLFLEDNDMIFKIWTPTRKNSIFVDLFKFTETTDFVNANIHEMEETFEANCVYMEATSTTQEQKRYWILLRQLKEELFDESTFYKYKIVYYYMKNIKGIINLNWDEKLDYDLDESTIHNSKINFYSCLQEKESTNFGLNVAPFKKPEKLIQTLDDEILSKFDNQVPDTSDLYEYARYNIALTLRKIASNEITTNKFNSNGIIDLKTYDYKTFISISASRKRFSAEIKRIYTNIIKSTIVLVSILIFIIVAASVLPSAKSWTDQNWSDYPIYIKIAVGLVSIVVLFILYFIPLKNLAITIKTGIYKYEKTKKNDFNNIYKGLELGEVSHKILSRIPYYLTFPMVYSTVKAITKK